MKKPEPEQQAEPLPEADQPESKLAGDSARGARSALDHDGLVSLKMLTGASGDGFSVRKDEEYRCDPATAVRFVKRIACQGHARP
jgi:hypothetical protein